MEAEKGKLLVPTSRVLVVLIFVFTVSLLTVWTTLLAAASLALLGLVISRPPLRLFASRFGTAIPFIAFAALSAYFSDNSPERAALMALRISTSVTVLINLTLVVPFHELLVALQRLHLPRLLVLMLLFTHRYIQVFRDEMERMKMARRSRGFSGGRHLMDRRGMETISASTGMMFVRALKRGVSISQAMRIRGFRDRLEMPLETGRQSWSGMDAAGVCTVILSCALLLIVDAGFVDTRYMDSFLMGRWI